MYNFKSNLLIIAVILLLNKCCLSFTRKNSLKHFTKQQQVNKETEKNKANQLFEIYKNQSKDYEIIKDYESYLENESPEFCNSSSTSKHLDDNEVKAAKKEIDKNCKSIDNEDFIRKLKYNMDNNLKFEKFINNFLLYFNNVFTYDKKDNLDQVIKHGLPCQLLKEKQFIIINTIVNFKGMTNSYLINADTESKVNDIMEYVNSFKKCAKVLYSHIKIAGVIEKLINSIDTSANKMKEVYKDNKLIKNILIKYNGIINLFRKYNLEI